MIISSPLGLFTQRETHVPLSQTSLQIRSALAAWDNTNHSAAAAMPTRILPIVSPPNRFLSSIVAGWFGSRSGRIGTEKVALATRGRGKAARNHCAEQQV